jgi:hypothetical protein
MLVGKAPDRFRASEQGIAPSDAQQSAKDAQMTPVNYCVVMANNCGAQSAESN